jgi:hypothetical protein
MFPIVAQLLQTPCIEGHKAFAVEAAEEPAQPALKRRQLQNQGKMHSPQQKGKSSELWEAKRQNCGSELCTYDPVTKFASWSPWCGSVVCLPAQS